jgi:hypothetical protein
LEILLYLFLGSRQFFFAKSKKQVAVTHQDIIAFLKVLMAHGAQIRAEIWEIYISIHDL